MKKIKKILAACILAASALCMTGCDEDDELFGPTKTWCEMPLTKKDDSGVEKTYAYAAFIYTDEELTNSTGGSANLKSGITIQPGITVVLYTTSECATGDSAISTALGNLSTSTYAIKNFPKSGSTVVNDGEGDTDTSYTMTGSRTKWTAIYLAKSALRKNQLKHPAAPSPITSGGARTELSADNLNWKTLLKSYLLANL